MHFLQRYEWLAPEKPFYFQDDSLDMAISYVMQELVAQVLALVQVPEALGVAQAQVEVCALVYAQELLVLALALALALDLVT